MASSQRPQQALAFSSQENREEDSSREKEDFLIAEEASVTNAQSIGEKTLNKSHEDLEFKDDSLNRKCLISCHKFLCDNLTAVEAVVYLQTNEILTQNDVNSISAKDTPYEKNHKLIAFVQQRGPEAFCCFMKSLRETRQKYIFDKLIEERRVAEGKNMSITNNISGGRNVIAPVSGGIVVQGDYYAPIQSSPVPSQPTPEELKKMLENLQSSLRRIYSKSYRSVIPIFSAEFFFDIEEKWVNLTLKLESDSTGTNDYATLLKKAFAKADMLIIEGNPVPQQHCIHRIMPFMSSAKKSKALPNHQRKRLIYFNMKLNKEMPLHNAV
uniref:CARD domain-containing protein n=1 Tax=Plectus sambesii TaxID=2011161 RepID=A0A914VW39_9BILA